MASREDWELGSGLPLEGADVEITGATFKVDASYAAGAIVLALTFLNTETGEAQEQLYSCGKNFEIRDKGASIAGTGKLNSQTGYGRFVAAAFELGDEFVDVLLERGSYKEAEVWVGLKFTLGTITFESMNPQTKKVGERTMIVPVAFLGAGEGEAPAAPAAKGTTTKPAAKSAAKGNAVPDTVLDAIKAEAAKVAANGEGFDAFFDAALELDGVATNKEAMKLVKDQGEGSIWAAAVAEGAE